MIFGRRAFFGYVVDPGGGTVWFANVPRPAVSAAERAATSPDQWRRQLVELFAGDHGPAAGLIADGHLELAGDSTHDLPKVPTWHRGPMVIVGDAAHALAHLGPGRLHGRRGRGRARPVPARPAGHPRGPGRLRGPAPPPGGAHRRPGGAHRQRQDPGRVGRVLRDLALPLVFKLLVTERSMAWIYDHHIDWDALVAAPAEAA